MGPPGLVGGPASPPTTEPLHARAAQMGWDVSFTRSRPSKVCRLKEPVTQGSPGSRPQIPLCQTHRSVYANSLFTGAKQRSQRRQTKSVGNTLFQQVTGAGNNRRERPHRDLYEDRQTALRSPTRRPLLGGQSERPQVSVAPLKDQRPKGRGGCD